MEKMGKDSKKKFSTARAAKIPVDLTTYRQWVVWRQVTANGKVKKIPINPKTGKNASVTDAKTWGSFDQAVKYWNNSDTDGIGFVLASTDPFVVVDLDDCLEPKRNELDEDAWDYIKAQRSYAEISPSGEGVHIWVRGTVRQNIRADGVEIYGDRRFITVTGRPIPTLSGETIADGGISFRKLWNATDAARSIGQKDQGSSGKLSDWELDRVINQANRGPNGKKFRRLWGGNTEGYASQSEADLALCRLLALSAGCRAQLIDAVFRRSKLFRAKWDAVHSVSGRTYGAMTVSKARTRALAELKEKWAVHSATDVVIDDSTLRGLQGDLIEGVIPRGVLGIVVGHSNLGKSPLLYQAGISVAAGIPFLGHPVNQGRVLYLDFENGTAQTNELIERISDHLGLTTPPRDFLCWNLNAAMENWGRPGYRGEEMIRDFKPDLVVLDSLTAFDPEIESRNSRATQIMLKLRGIIRDTGCAIVGTHHLSKPSTRTDKTPPPLEKCKLRDWFFRARGASALINATDVRIGIEEPIQSKGAETDGEEIVLVMRGFTRIKGETPLIYIARVFDENGEPVGYNEVTGSRLLFNPDQESAFRKLPPQFRFKDARMAYDRGPQATSDFLKKCLALKIVRKNGHRYSKTNTR
jgi:hypothetical protein